MSGTPRIRPISPPHAGSSSSDARASGAQPLPRVGVTSSEVCARVDNTVGPPRPSGESMNTSDGIPAVWFEPNSFGDSWSDSQRLAESVRFAHAFRTGKYRDYKFDAAGKVIVPVAAQQTQFGSRAPIAPANPTPRLRTTDYALPIDESTVADLVNSFATAVQVDTSVETAIDDLTASFSTAVQVDTTVHTAIEDLSTSFANAVLVDEANRSRLASPENVEMSADDHNNAFYVGDVGDFFATRAAVANVGETDRAQVLYPGRSAVRNGGMPSPILPSRAGRRYIHAPEEPQSPDQNICVFLPDAVTPPMERSTGEASGNGINSSVNASISQSATSTEAVDATQSSQSTITAVNSHPVSPSVTSTGPVIGSSMASTATNSLNSSVSPLVTCTGLVVAESTPSSSPIPSAANDEANTTTSSKSSDVTNQSDKDVNAESTANSSSIGKLANSQSSCRSSETSISTQNVSALSSVTCVDSVRNNSSAATTTSSTNVSALSSVDATPTTSTINRNSHPVSPSVTSTGPVTGSPTASTATNRVNSSVSPLVTCTDLVVATPPSSSSSIPSAANKDDDANTTSSNSSNVTNRSDKDVNADSTGNTSSDLDLANPQPSYRHSEASISTSNTSAVQPQSSAATNNSNTNASVSPIVDATPPSSSITSNVSNSPVSPPVTSTGPAHASSSTPVMLRTPKLAEGEPVPKRPKIRMRFHVEMEKQREEAAKQLRYRQAALVRRSLDRRHVVKEAERKQRQAFFEARKKEDEEARQQRNQLVRQHNEPAAQRPKLRLRLYGVEKNRREAALKKAYLEMVRRRAARDLQKSPPQQPLEPQVPAVLQVIAAPQPSPSVAAVSSPASPAPMPVQHRQSVVYVSPSSRTPRRLVDYDLTPPPSPVRRGPLVDYPSPPPTPVRRGPLVDYPSPPPSPTPVRRGPLVDYPSPPPSPIPRPLPPAPANVPAIEVPQQPPTPEPLKKDIGTECQPDAPKPVTTSTEVQTDAPKTTTSTEVQTDAPKTSVDCATQTDDVNIVPVVNNTVTTETQTPIMFGLDALTQTEPASVNSVEVQVDPPVDPAIEEPEHIIEEPEVVIEEPEPVVEEPEPAIEEPEPAIEEPEPAIGEPEPAIVIFEPMPDNVDDQSDDEPAEDQDEPEVVNEPVPEEVPGEQNDDSDFDPAPMDDNDFSDNEVEPFPDEVEEEGSSAENDDNHSVDQPIPNAPSRKRRRHDDPWLNLDRVNTFRHANLPAPAPLVMNQELESDQEDEPEDPFLQEFDPLTPTRLLQEAGGDHFISGLYESGIVTFQGFFDGVPRTSGLLARAMHHPEVIYNNPGDGIRQIVTGNDHLAMLSDSGQLFMLGRATEGQIGRDPDRHRHLTPTPQNMRRLVLEEMPRDADGNPLLEFATEVRFAYIAASGDLTVAWTAEGHAYACGTTENGQWTSWVMKRVPGRDHQYNIDGA